MPDISHLLSPQLLELYEKNREYIESNKDIEFLAPKGEITYIDEEPEVKKPISIPVRLTEDVTDKLKSIEIKSKIV